MIIPLKEYMEKCNKRIISNKYREYQTLIEYSFTASKVISSIDNGSYADRVLASLAPKVYLNINDDKLLTS